MTQTDDRNLSREDITKIFVEYDREKAIQGTGWGEFERFVDYANSMVRSGPVLPFKPDEGLPFLDVQLLLYINDNDLYPIVEEGLPYSRLEHREQAKRISGDIRELADKIGLSMGHYVEGKWVEEHIRAMTTPFTE